MRNYSPSTIRTHLKALKAKHLQTSKTIQNENSRPDPDSFLLQNLKRRRLKLKDEIAGYSFI